MPTDANVFFESEITGKVGSAETMVHRLLLGETFMVPERPARDLPIVMASELPPKKGLSFPEGQARLLHDLASIELQAMELGLRTLCEFPNADAEFREQLGHIVLEERMHLGLCLKAMENLGFHWGSWPAHLNLWIATDKDDSLLDRVLIVHRYLEGSGLDAGETFLRRLDRVGGVELRRVVKKIFTDEIPHVAFGSRWYQTFVQRDGLDPEKDFPSRMEKLRFRIPKRLEKVAREPRRLAGFTEMEMDYLDGLRLRSGAVKTPLRVGDSATCLPANHRA